MVTKEELQECVNSGMRIRDIMDKFNINKDKVKNLLRKYKIKLIPKPPLITKEQLIHYISIGYGITRISKELGVSSSGLHPYFKKYNLESHHKFKSSTTTKFRCEICHRDNSMNKVLFDIKGICRSCNKTIKRRLIKKILIDYKGGKCHRCGYNKNYGALDFHHESNKRGSVSNFISKCLSSTETNIPELFNELNNCVVLCANCHREEHCEQYINGRWDNWMFDRVQPILDYINRVDTTGPAHPNECSS